MNEQHIDALPPVQPAPSDDQNMGGGTTGPMPAQNPMAQQGMVNPVLAPPPGVTATPVPATGVTPPPVSNTPPIADDVDLIEKEWVAKAKEMVENTKQDPYQQNQVMTGVKADYLKKRFNRDLKIKKPSGEA